MDTFEDPFGKDDDEVSGIYDRMMSYVIKEQTIEIDREKHLKLP